MISSNAQRNIDKKKKISTSEIFFIVYLIDDGRNCLRYCCCCSIVALVGALIGLIIAGTALGIGIALLVKTSGKKLLINDLDIE